MMKIKTEKRSTWVRPFIVLTSLGLFIVLIYLIFAFEKDRQFVPITLADLQGVWTTTTQGYEDRFVQFSDETITFGWGAAGVGSYTIKEIHSGPGELMTRVRIRYSDMNLADYEFGFDYLRQGGGVIRMKNTKGEDWERISVQAIYTPDFR